jgi:hypothetical protein
VIKVLGANWQAADDAELEREPFPDVEFILQRTPPGSLTPVPPEALARADAVINYSATQHVGGNPDAFARAKIAVRAGVGFDNLDVAGWSAKGVPEAGDALRADRRAPGPNRELPGHGCRVRCAAMRL